MEPLRSEYRTTFEKMSPNLASVIAQNLNLKDFLALASTSSKLRTIFRDFAISWKAVLKNHSIPESILAKMNSFEDFKAIFKNKMIKINEGTGNYYLRFSKNLGKSWIVFPGSDLPYDWKGSEYWPLETHSDSWFGENPIPHLHSVCWFRVNGDYVVPKGKYSLNLRILADKDFKLNNSYFFLRLEGSDQNLVNFVFTKEVEKDLIKKAEFTVLKLGEFDLSDHSEKEVKVMLRSQEGDNWWKSGFWLDAIIFIPI